MSMRYPAGLITTASPVNAQYPSGVWTPAQSAPYQAQGLFATDPSYEYTTLLINGNGTNGGQNNTFLDSSSNNFSVTRNGNTTQGTFSPYGTTWGNYFDGSGDYLTFPNNTAFAFGTGAFTIEFWVNSIALSDSFILSGRAAIGTMHITYGGFGGSTAGSLRYVGSSTITSGSTLISNGLWNHCAIVRDGSNNITLYVNGASVGTGTDTTNYASTSGTWFINSNDSGPTPGQAGYISNLRIVKGTAVYTSTFAPSTTPLTAITNTSLLTCQSNRFIDTSTNAFAITVNGNPSVQPFSPFNPVSAYTPAITAGSGYFDGSGDYLGLPSSSAFTIGTGAFTAEMWCYFTSTPNGHLMTFNDGVGTDSPTGYYYVAYESGYIVSTGGNASGSGVFTTYTMPLNSWVHIVAVRSGTNHSIFVNGTRVVTRNDSTYSYTSGSSPTVGRGGPPSTSITGWMAGVRLLKGVAAYDPTQSTITVPTAPYTSTANTSLLLSFTNASISDSAGMANFETVGNAQVSTSVVKYGTGSFSAASGGWALTSPSQNLEFGSGDFTIEFWWYPTSTSRQALYHGSWGTDWSIGIDYSSVSTNQTIGIWASSNGSSWNLINSDPGGNGIGTVQVIQNAWNHIAFVRSGTTWLCFVNGVAGTRLTGISGSLVNRATSQKAIGVWWSNSNAPYSQTGYFDEFRITKGLARYIGNFTPPAAPFPKQ